MFDMRHIIWHVTHLELRIKVLVIGAVLLVWW